MSRHAHRLAASAGLSLAILGMTGCSDRLPGREDVAAEAGDQTLPPERLATLIVREPTRPTVVQAGLVALAWVDYTLLAQAAGQAEPLTDSATAAAALGPDLVLLTLRRWHDTLVSRRPRAPDALADSLFARDSLRALQHILLRVSDPQDIRVITSVQQRGDSLLRQARAGADFAELARRASEDPSGQQGGSLGVVKRGTLLPEFERPAWRIAPGKVVGIPTRLGLHIVRRPPLSEVRGQFLAYADSLQNLRADSIHVDSLRRAKGMTLAEETLAVLRDYFDDPATRTRVKTPLATWEGGELGLAQASIWIDMLQPSAYWDLRGSSDSTLSSFTRDLAAQFLLLQEAQRAGIHATGSDWRTLYDGYRRGLREALGALGLSDSGRTTATGEGPGRVNALLDGLTSNQAKWRPLPSALAAVLRARMGYRLHEAGLQRAATRAFEMSISDSAIAARQDTAK